ncbi:unnamed protein product [Cercospora beticola]|nr:unnamed protein product [Cercospora beticola]
MQYARKHGGWRASMSRLLEDARMFQLRTAARAMQAWRNSNCRQWSIQHAICRIVSKTLDDWLLDIGSQHARIYTRRMAASCNSTWLLGCAACLISAAASHVGGVP